MIYTDLFFELVRTDFKMRYHNSILGFFWVLLKPFLIFLIILAVFSWLFNNQDPFYYLNLLLGILLYSYFAEGTLRGVTCLYDKSSIILKVNFPKVIAVLTSVANSFISFFAGFMVFLIFWLIGRPIESFSGFGYLILQIIILSILILGLSFFSSIIYTKLRDLQSIWEVLLQLLFYSTPIFYPITIIPDRFRQLFLLNPLAVIITESRSALITGQTYSWQQSLYALTVVLLLLFLGFWFFQKNVKKVAENF